MANPKRLNFLTHERLLWLLDYNPATGSFVWKNKSSKFSKIKIGNKAGCKNADGYLILRINYTIYSAHILAWFYVNKQWPRYIIDHINQDPSDNRIDNLRESNHSHNSRNARTWRSGRSGFVGASYDEKMGKFVSRICVRRERKIIGWFETAQEAHEAYLKEANKLNAVFTFLDNSADYVR